MRVLNFISGRQLGGSKQAFLDYSLMCHQQGFEIHSMIRTRSPLKGMLQKMPAAISDNIIELNYFRLKWPLFRQWAIRQFKRATIDVNPDVVLVHKPIDLYFIKRTLPKAKIVAVVHSFTVNNLEYADHIFAVSNAQKDYLVNHDCRAPITVINNAIAVPNPPSVEVERSVTVIGTMAVFRKTKRLDLLLESFYQLKQQNVPFKGIVAGAGIQKIYLKFLIKRWKLKDCVELRPWVTDKEEFYQDIDIFCITSKSETFSISLVEAMARRKCVVATACGGPNEIIEHQVDGILTAVGNVTSLTGNLRMLIESKENQKQLATAGFKKAKRLYSNEVLQKKIANQLNLMVK